MLLLKNKHMRSCLYDLKLHKTATASYNMSHRTRKPTICICKNKDADQLRSNCEADQRLCFRYMDSAIPLLVIFKISSFQPASVTVQSSSCQSWSETQIIGFLMQQLISCYVICRQWFKISQNIHNMEIFD